jgi:alkaline phosphatase D
MKTWTRAVCAALALAVAGFAGNVRAAERTVVVVLFDGFAPAMMDATATPNFDRMAREGVSSRHLVPAFPTISLINHTTFETGCWPSHHGILSNLFYDPKKGLFKQSDDAAWRTGCESLWEAAERQGMRSAALNFVGRWSSVKGKRATYINPEVPWKKRQSDDQVLREGLRLLKLSWPGHPRLIALYFPIPDEVAHYNGTTAPKTEAAVRRADAIVGRLMAAIRALPPAREGTLVIGTDHGMMDVGPLVNVGRLMNAFAIRGKQATDGATSFLYLDDPKDAPRIAKDLASYQYAFDVYRKGHFPAYAHLGNGPRVPDLLLVAHPPYWMVGPEVLPQWADMLGINWFWPATFTPFTGGLKATHGYDPHIVQMHGIFYAWGAGVARGVTIPRLDQIDVHPTVMKLLDLKPGKPVDGHAIPAVFGPSD